MSEYKYYEFLAMERPLTSKEMAYLRSLSTRAHITPVSFANEYDWGDFKGDPFELMKRFFDAHVFIGNWSTGTFMLRVPIEAISEEIVSSVSYMDILRFDSTETHWIISWDLGEWERATPFDVTETADWMALLSPIRDELLRGDMRSLYIGWLYTASGGLVEEDGSDLEPFLPEGLGNLTASQQALVEFIEIDQDMLAGAAMGCPERRPETPTEGEIDRWLEGLPPEESRLVLKQLLQGRGQEAASALKNRFAAWQRGLGSDAEPGVLRTVGEIWENAEKAKAARLERERLAKEEKERKEREERRAYLDRLYQDLPKAWESVRQDVERGTSASYNFACRQLVDLFEAYSIHSSQEAFQRELSKFMAKYLKRGALIRRLKEANIWWWK